MPSPNHVCALLGVVLSLGVSDAAWAGRVVVFGLSPRGIDAATVEEGTQTLLKTLRDLEGVTVVDAKTAKARIGVDLVEQARACEYDVFCLVELGELLEAQQLLVGHLSRPPPTHDRADEGLELKLMVLDVAKASPTEVLLWRVPDLDPEALGQATSAAARRLFAPRDIQVQFVLTPSDAEVRFFAEPVAVTSGQTMPYWSGTYHAVVRAPGYLEQALRVRLPAGQGTLQIPIELQPDPLFVAGQGGTVRPFERSSRRTGSGASAQTVGAVDTRVPTPAAYQGPLPWVVAGGGVALSVIGGVLMQRAQGSYNERAVERRYTPTITVPADVAMRDRDSARSTYRTGSGLMLGGVAVMVGAAVWMIVDAVLEDPPPQRVAVEPPRAPSPATELAARRMAAELSR